MEQVDFEPSVKGSVFRIAVQGVKNLIRRDRISRHEVEAQLEASDLCYLDDKILLAGWYPVGAFERLSRISVERLGQGESEFFVGAGENAAKRLLGSEVYSRYAELVDARGDGAGRSMLSMAELIFNFTSWELRGDGSGDLDHFEIEVSQADAMPEVLRYAAQGFIKHVASLMLGFPVAVVSHRPSPDVILYCGRPGY